MKRERDSCNNINDIMSLRVHRLLFTKVPTRVRFVSSCVSSSFCYSSDSSILSCLLHGCGCLSTEQLLANRDGCLLHKHKKKCVVGHRGLYEASWTEEITLTTGGGGWESIQTDFRKVWTKRKSISKGG